MNKFNLIPKLIFTAILLLFLACEKEDETTPTTSDCGDASTALIATETDSSNFEFSSSFSTKASDILTYNFTHYLDQMSVEISVGPTNSSLTSAAMTNVSGTMDVTIREKDSKKELYTKTIKSIIAIDEDIATTAGKTYEVEIDLSCFTGGVAIELGK